MEKLSVILSDNQLLTNIGITTILKRYYHDSIVFDEARTKDEIIGKLHTNNFQVLIIDYDLVGFKDISEIGEIKRAFPTIGVLVVTADQNPDSIIKVIDAGIVNYLLKTCLEDELIEALQATLDNRKYFSGLVLDVLLKKNSYVRHSVELGKLTVAEIEVVRMITLGLTTKEIANRKNLSFHTITTHRKNIFRKLGISNTSELHLYAMRSGIIDSTEYYI